ncbi:hypothetical protein WG66_013157 [Moniliophthora roreri]|uniref:5-formyltetrahydrofolate cyclo-ligase n=1 Tax=Moniliophthora roreri TaxID=221103 RepID=A0A0W0FNX0_MONRR|nr:hypothetical protein WG66_013157 [Moniliophthora roreri]
MLASSTALNAQKKSLRKSIGIVLRGLTSSNINEQSTAVTSKVLALKSFQEAQNICCYLNMPSGELDTSSIVNTILESGKNLFVPKIEEGNRMQFVRIYNQNDLNTLPRGLWGIKEPTTYYNGESRENVLDTRLDMILVPGVAFDRSMSRLGHGKGYYDRYLSTYTALGKPRPLLVALSLREQIVDEVPVDETDWKMDMILTPDESLGNCT